MRKRRERSAPARTAWLWGPLLAGALLLVCALAVLFVRDAMVVRDSLRATQASLSEVMVAAGDVDLEVARTQLVAADASLATARSRSSGPLWSLAERAPVVGDDVRVLQRAVSLATAAIAVAEVATAEGEDLLGGGLAVSVVDGRVDLSPLVRASALVDRLPTDRLAAARDELAAVEPSRFAPDELVTGREDALRLADSALETIDRAGTMLDALPGFLGADDTRRYFLAVQSPAELRGTGGLIGFWAVVEVESGQLRMTASDVYDAEDETSAVAGNTGDIRSLAGDVGDRVRVPADFGERYGHTAAAGLFANVNVDPDLPTTASVVLDLVHQRTGLRLDGMILLDPLAMQLILAATGADELAVPMEVAPAGGQRAILVADLARFVLVDVYDGLGASATEERKALLRGLGDAAFARVFDGGWDAISMGQAVAQAANGRHLQVFSSDPSEQAAFERLGVAGSLAATDGADLLAITANNAVGGKQDVHVRHHVTGEITLSDPRRRADGTVDLARRAAVRVEIDNQLPTSGMDTYIIGSCVDRDGRNAGCFGGPPGLNRTWFSVWVPSGTALVSASGDDGAAAIHSGRIRDLQVFDRFVRTPSGGRSGFDIVYEGRAPGHLDDRSALVYVLDWWEQGKAIPTSVDLAVAPPDGFRVAGIEVHGGTDQIVGVFGQDEPLAVEVGADGRGRVVGTVRSDVRFEVNLVGAG